MCSECVQSVFRVCLECAQGAFRVCSECVQSAFSVCSECVQSVFNIDVISSPSASSVSIFGIFSGSCPSDCSQIARWSCWLLRAQRRIPWNSEQQDICRSRLRETTIVSLSPGES